MAILKKAIVEKKLIITLPWVVQYLFMLDYITLRLTYYRQLIQLLYELYINLSMINSSNKNKDKNENNKKNNSNRNMNISSISNSNDNNYNNTINNIENENSNSNNNNNYILELLDMRPTSIFILRLCLGWLFDHHSNMIEDYYGYRKQYIGNTNLEFNNDKRINNNITLMNVTKPISINSQKIIKNKIETELISTQITTTTTETIAHIPLKIDDSNKSLIMHQQNQQEENLQEQQQEQEHQKPHNNLAVTDADNDKKCEKHLNIKTILQEYSYDPLLERILNVACPFLADFRVSIMPTKFSKLPSRTGRYRYITTRMSFDTITTTTSLSTTSTTSISNSNFNTSTNTITVNKNDNHKNSILNNCSRINNSDTQTKLIEAFLHSQNLSMRRTVEFLIERITSAVIKDYQMEILLPSRNYAIIKVNQINSIKRVSIFIDFKYYIRVKRI